jgi:hypothetical protein
MRAKVTTAFNGWAEDEPAPRDFDVGDEIRDNLAWQAVNTKVNPDDPNSPMFAEWTQEPTTGERDVLGSNTFRPLWTVQPVGTERPAPGDHPNCSLASTHCDRGSRPSTTRAWKRNAEPRQAGPSPESQPGRLRRRRSSFPATSRKAASDQGVSQPRSIRAHDRPRVRAQASTSKGRWGRSLSLERG